MSTDKKKPDATPLVLEKLRWAPGHSATDIEPGDLRWFRKPTEGPVETTWMYARRREWEKANCKPSQLRKLTHAERVANYRQAGGR